VIVPIVKKDTDRAEVDAAVDKLTAALKGAGIRVKVGLGFTAEALHMLIVAMVACVNSCAHNIACHVVSTPMYTARQGPVPDNLQ
jgi:hypothetical protein